jgi:multidrug efflux pump subunit AcrA (membrane-fusion protein)
MAKASLVQAQAQRDLARATLSPLRGSGEGLGAVAQQDYETQVSGAKTADALVVAQQANVDGSQDNVNQAQANLDRVIALQEFKNVRAPFAGVVTVRNVDVGYLISSSGGGQGTSPSTQSGATTPSLAFGNEMFRVAQLNTLRVFVGVPQSAASAITIGMPGAVTFADLPGREFQAKVTRTASSLDPTARTLLTELQMPNKDEKLFPGMYATVHFRQHRDSPPMLVRGDALITNASGIQLAVLSDSPRGQGLKTVHLAPIQPGRDFGTDMEIISGVRPGDLVVINPGDEIREGAVVRPFATPPARGGSGR